MITSKELAKLAGVSQSTVSRCLNGSPLVAVETRKKVMELAEKHNFELNNNARSLRTKKTRTIGLVLPKHFKGFSSNIYISNLLSYIKDNLSAYDLDLLLLDEKKSDSRKNNIVKTIRNRKVDGLIVLQHEFDKNDIKWITKTIPCVFIDTYRDQKETKGINIINFDNYLSGFMVGEYLCNLGHKSIMTITAKDDLGSMKERTKGFKEALALFGVDLADDLILYGDFTFKSGYNLVIAEIQKVRRSTAIFAQNDMMALGCMEALKSYNIQIPEDISVMGHDNLDMGIWFKPTLSTANKPTHKVADAAVDLLINGNVENNKNKIMFKTELIIRDSTSIPRM